MHGPMTEAAAIWWRLPSADQYTPVSAFYLQSPLEAGAIWGSGPPGAIFLPLKISALPGQNPCIFHSCSLNHCLMHLCLLQCGITGTTWSDIQAGWLMGAMADTSMTMCLAYDIRIRQPRCIPFPIRQPLFQRLIIHGMMAPLPLPHCHVQITARSSRTVHGVCRQTQALVGACLCQFLNQYRIRSWSDHGVQGSK